MVEIIKLIIGIELILVFSAIILFVLFFILFHILLYLFRWYEIANTGTDSIRKRDILESLFFFILETGASIYLHFLMVLRNIKRLLSKEDSTIAVIKETERNPIILVHGYNENYGTMSYLKRKLETNYGFFNIFYIEYGNPLTLNFKANREIFARDLIEKFNSLKDCRVDFVCHSLGGLMLLDFLSQNENTNQYRNLKERISKIILLGSPLRGSKLAIFNRNSVAQNMRYNCQFVNSISYDALKGLSIYSIYSTFDELVLPYESSKLPDYSSFCNIEFDCIGHMGLLMANRIISKIALSLIE